MQEKLVTKSVIYKIIKDARLVNIKITVQENNEEAIARPLKLRRASNFIIKSQHNQRHKVIIH
jgi:hypothetical protein